MEFLTDQEQEIITKEIRRLEEKSSGKMVCVITRSSHGYRLYPVLWAAILALASPLLGLILPYITVWPLWKPLTYEIWYQPIIFVMLWSILSLERLRMLITPSSTQLGCAKRLAREQFYAQGLHRTEDKTGILIFVSLAERYAEIIADDGINNKTTPKQWVDQVHGLIKAIQEDKAAHGYLKIIRNCSAILATHFPNTDRSQYHRQKQDKSPIVVLPDPSLIG